MPGNTENGIEVDDKMFHYPGLWAEILTGIQNGLGNLMTIGISFDSDGYELVGQEMQYFLDGIGLQETQSPPCDIGPYGPYWMIDVEDTTDLSIEIVALCEVSKLHEQSSLVDRTAPDGESSELQRRRMRQQHWPCL